MKEQKHQNICMRKGKREWETETQRDRDTERQADRHDRLTHIHADRQTCRSRLR